MRLVWCFFFFHLCRVTELKNHSNHFFLCFNQDSYGMAVNQEHFWTFVGGAETAANRVADIDQTTRPEGDPERRSVVGRFKIIAANHNDH